MYSFLNSIVRCLQKNDTQVWTFIVMVSRKTNYFTSLFLRTTDWETFKNWVDWPNFKFYRFVELTQLFFFYSASNKPTSTILAFFWRHLAITKPNAHIFDYTTVNVTRASLIVCTSHNHSLRQDIFLTHHDRIFCAVRLLFVSAWRLKNLSFAFTKRGDGISMKPIQKQYSKIAADVKNLSISA